MKHIKLYEEFVTESNNIKDVKKTITQVFRKMGVTQTKSNTTSVRGFSRNVGGKGYKHEYNGLVSLQGFSEQEAEELFNELRSKGVELSFPQVNGFGYDWSS
jgi:hypothetical protein